MDKISNFNKKEDVQLEFKEVELRGILNQVSLKLDKKTNIYVFGGAVMFSLN